MKLQVGLQLVHHHQRALADLVLALAGAPGGVGEEALLEEDMQSSGEGVEVQSVAEEADLAEGAAEDTEQLTAEGETTSEPLSGEETAAENDTDAADTEPGAPEDGTAVIVDVPVIGDVPAIGNAPATYIVQDGDWVYKIARTFNIAPLDLLAANPVIGMDQKVYPGQELIIPGGNLEPASSGEQGSIEGATIMAPAGAVASSNYAVQAGDTVFSIALNVTAEILN